MVSRLSPERIDALVAAAAEATVQLAGAHRVRIKGLDPTTGNPTGLVSDAGRAEHGNYIQRALAHMQTVGTALGLAPSQPSEFVASPNPQTTSSGAVAVYLQQSYKAIPIFQAAQTLNFTPAGAIEETIGTTVTVPRDLPARPKWRPEEAVLKAAAFVAVPQPDEYGVRDSFGEPLPTTVVDLTGWSPRVIAVFFNKPDQPTVIDSGPFSEPIKASLMWFPVGEDLRLAWQVILGLPKHEGQYRVLVDAEDGRVLYCHQLVQGVAARGNVYTTDGAAGRQLTPFPRPIGDYGLPIPAALPPGFPYDWVAGDSTIGNDTTAHLDDSGPAGRGVSRNGVMTFDPVDPQGDDQKIVNILYFTCFAHDFFYLLGFREEDGNFQTDNFGRGGLASDPLDARAYHGAVWATASMNTPSDSSSPVMKMGLVTSTNRHTAFDATVVFHEYTHGVTNRLVGGPLNDHSLDAPQSAGMGEGWSDYFACSITGKTVVAAWVVDTPGGIREFAYDSQFPDDFGQLGKNRYTEPHNIGEVWCAALMEMNRQIGAQLGLQLVVDALKLSSANPSFLDARDALLKALDHKALPRSRHDQLLVAMWKVFARFGMGPGARSDGAFLTGITADFNAPAAPIDSGGTMPEPRAWTRVGAATDRAPLQSVVTAVAAEAGRVDVLLVASDGGIYTTARPNSIAAWSSLTRVGAATDRAPLRSVVTAVAAEPGRIDFFLVASDGGIYTTARPNSTAAWDSWTRVGTATDRAPLQSVVTAVAAEPARVDLFLVASDGGIYTTARPTSLAAWDSWTRVGTAADRAPLRSVVTAVAAERGRVDLFLIASDGGIYTTARPNTLAPWGDWTRVGTAADRAPLQSVATTVTAEPGRVDLFLVASDGGIYTTARPTSMAAWDSWTRVGTATDRAALQSVVTAVAAAPGRVDLFLIANDGGSYTTTRATSMAAWGSWTRVGTAADRAPLGSVVTAVVADPGRVDLFMVASDGGIYTARRT
jgi:extracellular elastinolytic metalloproteinase